MLLIRRFEEKSAEVYTLGKIRGFLHLYIGEEAVAVGAMPAFTADDAIVATYREHGHALARGIPASAVMAEMYGKANGTSRGRGGSMHIFDASRRFYGGYAIVGGGLPIAVGLALADRMQERPRITACFFGEGAVAEGEFHESLNLAALWHLPVLFLCENNRYAMGTALMRSESQTESAPQGAKLQHRVAGGRRHGRIGGRVGGARSGRRSAPRPRAAFPRASHLPLPRPLDGRPGLYRNKAEVEEWKHRCPVETFASMLRAEGLLSDAERKPWRPTWRPRSRKQWRWPKPGRGSRSRISRETSTRRRLCHEQDHLS